MEKGLVIACGHSRVSVYANAHNVLCARNLTVHFMNFAAGIHSCLHQLKIVTIVSWKNIHIICIYIFVAEKSFPELIRVDLPRVPPSTFIRTHARDTSHDSMCNFHIDFHTFRVHPHPQLETVETERRNGDADGPDSMDFSSSINMQDFLVENLGRKCAIVDHTSNTRVIANIRTRAHSSATEIASRDSIHFP